MIITIETIYYVISYNSGGECVYKMRSLKPSASDDSSIFSTNAGWMNPEDRNNIIYIVTEMLMQVVNFKDYVCRVC